MQPKVSIPCSQQPSSESCCVPVEFSPHFISFRCVRIWRNSVLHMSGSPKWFRSNLPVNPICASWIQSTFYFIQICSNMKKPRSTYVRVPQVVSQQPSSESCCVPVEFSPHFISFRSVWILRNPVLHRSGSPKWFLSLSLVTMAWRVCRLGAEETATRCKTSQWWLC
jgi:hypothetical protein